jgi:hypothetical protein
MVQIVDAPVLFLIYMAIRQFLPLSLKYHTKTQDIGLHCTKIQFKDLERCASLWSNIYGIRDWIARKIFGAPISN